MFADVYFFFPTPEPSGEECGLLAKSRQLREPNARRALFEAFPESLRPLSFSALLELEYLPPMRPLAHKHTICVFSSAVCGCAATCDSTADAICMRMYHPDHPAAKPNEINGLREGTGVVVADCRNLALNFWELGNFVGVAHLVRNALHIFSLGFFFSCNYTLPERWQLIKSFNE